MTILRNMLKNEGGTCKTDVEFAGSKLVTDKLDFSSKANTTLPRAIIFRTHSKIGHSARRIDSEP